ncbi:MAG: tagaturonate reductase [Spirochaetes bacterium]|nr:tagaturonate reductase [Spirochaetota bacterium]
MKVAQFGEGGFLRGFVDWMFNSLNYDVTVIQPIEKGMLDVLAKQGYRYNLLLRGIENGKVVEQQTKISCIKDGINPYADWDKFLNFAKDGELKIVVSNTTESGIEYKPQSISDAPHLTFPAKFALFLKARYDAGGGGLVILPCELIDNNGDALRNCVVKYAKDWNFGDGFLAWLGDSSFCNTLVDRIVTGFPKDIDTKGDDMFDTAEIYHLWVIEGRHEDTLPLQKAGFNVIWTDDAAPYKKRKVRILNGAHTALVSYAMLRGFTTVGECMANDEIRAFIKACVFDEIIPTLDLSKEELESYANSVLERFANPYIHHLLASISLNSFDKFKVRVLPSILEFEKRFGKKPEKLMLAFDALYEFYQTDKVNDAQPVIDFAKGASKEQFWQKMQESSL